MLMDALDLVEAELEAQAERRAVVKEQAARGAVSKVTKQPPNPLLLGLSPLKYMVRCLRMVKAPDLEQALLVMPFHYVSRFVPMLLQVRKML
jgi:U3 small nucleolar RNA-associated protein 12